MASGLGFDGIGVNEHHQNAYGLMPAPNLIASALIQRTKKVKIAILGRALPLLSNPMNIAEEYAMLDNLSRGRIICGFVRGIGAEYHSTGVNPYFSHERFHEAHDLIIQAWTKPGPFPFEGQHYNMRYVNCWPRPYQQPHPPIWIPSQGSSETVAWAADPARKYPFLVTFSATDLVIRYLNTYRDQARQYGYEPESGQFGWACPVYVAETDERAKAEAGHAIETLFNNYLRMPMEMLIPPGYTSLNSMKNFLKMRTAVASGTKRRRPTASSPAAPRSSAAPRRCERRSRKCATRPGSAFSCRCCNSACCPTSSPSAAWRCSPARSCRISGIDARRGPVGLPR